MDNKKINIMDITLEEFQQMENFHPGDKTFNQVVIVPMDDIHDSAYRCMKYILINNIDEIVGVIGGYSDVLNLNGIGGYGYDKLKHIKSGLIPIADWTIDCLPESRCLRLFGPRMILKDKIICSSVDIYDIKTM